MMNASTANGFEPSVTSKAIASQEHRKTVMGSIFVHNKGDILHGLGSKPSCHGGGTYVSVNAQCATRWEREIDRGARDRVTR